MPTVNDLTGAEFGRLVAVELVRIVPKRGALWRCRCVCGNICEVLADSLRRGNTKSCGCLFKDGRAKKNFKHGMRDHPLYATWCGMRRRCNDPNHPKFKYYGGLGISVCPQWDNFEKFVEDMGPKPTCKHSLDRKENSQGYSKGNCRWRTQRQQCRNKRRNIKILVNNEYVCVAEAVERGLIACSSREAYRRVRNGLTIPMKGTDGKQEAGDDGSRA